MSEQQSIIMVETDRVAIEVCEGYLTIGTYDFPGDCICLTPEEAEKTLSALLRWKSEYTSS